MKYHLACGDIYLDGYVNIDIEGEIGVPEVRKTLDTYYDNRTVGQPQKKFVDMLCDVTKLPDVRVDEIVAVQILEHFPIAQIPGILKHWRERCGVLLLTVPDVMKTATGGKEKLPDDFIIRHLYGTQKNEYHFHKSGFTPSTLRKFLNDAGFATVNFRKFIKHDYPAIQVIAS